MTEAGTRRHSSLLLSLLPWLLLAPATSAISVAPPLEPAAASIHWRQVLILADNLYGCPNVDTDWRVEPAFGGLGSSEMDRFCTYTYASDEAVPAASVAALHTALLPFGDVSPDKMVVVQMGDPLADVLWPSLRDRFLEQAGSASLPPPTRRERTRLAVVDTAATRETGAVLSPGNSSHGYTLVNMAAALLCADLANDASCLAKLTTQLALPWIAVDTRAQALVERDDANGGFVGSQLDLAQALHNELVDWHTGADRGTRLVLNLSVAWDPIFGGWERRPRDMAPPVLAVYRSLEAAACLGALTVASAGNVTGGPQGRSPGAMMPAAWTDRPAPSNQVCRKRYGVAPPGDTHSQPELRRVPLLHAVGGADENGDRLANGRPSSWPPLVAYGDHGLVESHVAGTPTASLTGTSVSALVTSAVAAAVWTYRPELDARAVIQHVYTAGVDRGQPRTRPDVCPADCSDWPEVRHVSLCRTVALVCAGQPGVCAGPSPHCETPRPLPVPVDFSTFDATAVTRSASGLTAQYGPLSDCGAVDLYRHASLPVQPDHPCPAAQFHGLAAVPWTNPQPATDLCPNCSLTSGGGVLEARGSQSHTLRIALPSSLPGALGDPTLVTPTAVYNLHGIEACLVPGGTCVITDLPAFGAGPVSLTWSVSESDGTRSAESVLLPVRW